MNTFQILEVWSAAAVLYLSACYLIAFGLRRIERRYAMVR